MMEHFMHDNGGFMNEVSIFLDSGQTIETYLTDDVIKAVTDEIKKYNTNEDGSKVIWVGTDNNPELIVSTKSIVAIKVVWDVEMALGEY